MYSSIQFCVLFVSHLKILVLCDPGVLLSNQNLVVHMLVDYVSVVVNVTNQFSVEAKCEQAYF